MDENLLCWVYLVNAVILINHEIDSAYWQEWKLISSNDKNGINGFLIIHIPMIFAVLLGLVLVYDHQFTGLILSLMLSACGLFAFFFHWYHLRKGRPEFDSLISKGLILSTCILSLFQLWLTIKLML